jgi:hypothetical protein
MKECKDCRNFGSGNCFSCTEQDSSFEPKEKKMKVIVEVERTPKNFIKHIRCDGTNTYLYESDCEPVQEGWLTEEQANTLLWDAESNSALEIKNTKKRWIERGWIKQSKTAKEKFEEYWETFKPDQQADHVSNFVFNKLHDLAVEMRKEAEKK